jgi:hypothetical protein
MDHAGLPAGTAEHREAILSVHVRGEAFFEQGNPWMQFQVVESERAMATAAEARLADE